MILCTLNTRHLHVMVKSEYFPDLIKSALRHFASESPAIEMKWISCLPFNLFFCSPGDTNEKEFRKSVSAS